MFCIFSFSIHIQQSNKQTLVLITDVGKCLYVSPFVAKIRCFQNVTSDQWTCVMKFGSFTYYGEEMDLRKPSSSSFYHEQIVNKWQIENSSAEKQTIRYECCPESFVDIIYTFNLVRHNR